MYHSSIRRRALGFLVLQFWLSLDWFSGFCFKKLWFFYFLHFGLWILCSLAFDFWFSSKVQMGFWNFLWSEQQLTTSTDLKQLQNTIVIDRTAWQTKCHWNNFLLVKYDYKGFLSKKKKKPSVACTPLCHTYFILACHTKFLISMNMIRSMIQSVVQSVIQSGQIQVLSTLLNGETPNPQYPVCIFSILFSIHFPRCWQGEFVKQSRASSKSDHFLYSHDLNLWFRGNMEGEISC